MRVLCSPTTATRDAASRCVAHPVLPTTEERRYNQTPYEKGYCLLSYLRSLVPSDEAFDGFMREWCQGHKFQSVTSDMMFACFLAKFPDLVRPATR